MCIRDRRSIWPIQRKLDKYSSNLSFRAKDSFERTRFHSEEIFKTKFPFSNSHHVTCAPPNIYLTQNEWKRHHFSLKKSRPREQRVAGKCFVVDQKTYWYSGSRLTWPPLNVAKSTKNRPDDIRAYIGSRLTWPPVKRGRRLTWPICPRTDVATLSGFHCNWSSLQTMPITSNNDIE